MSNEFESDVKKTKLGRRFRGFLPVVVDLETAGFNSKTDALLQIGMSMLDMDASGKLFRAQSYFYQVRPFEGANLEQAALQFTGIDPFAPSRKAMAEDLALKEMFGHVRTAIKKNGCTRAILVGHNAHFDQGFLNAAAERQLIKRNPFHPFSNFDTVSLAALAYGQTVLAKSCETAGLEFDNKEAHSADYDAEKTADLFCLIINRWKELGGWRDSLI
jgi:ribonuclease T